MLSNVDGAIAVAVAAEDALEFFVTRIVNVDVKYFV